MCVCDEARVLADARKTHSICNQLNLPFDGIPETRPKQRRRQGPDANILLRQPHRFPHGKMVAHDPRCQREFNPIGYREAYYEHWAAMRRSQGLPDTIINPTPSWRREVDPPLGWYGPLLPNGGWHSSDLRKKPHLRKPVASVIDIASGREGHRPGNAVPGQLCDPGRMTA